MSLSTLHPAPRVQVQRSSTNGEGKEASFLTFNYVNKHARVRVSPTPLDLSSFEGKGDLLAVANTQGWFAAITRAVDGKIQLVCSPLSQLHSSFRTNPGAGVDEIDFTPQRILTISPATPNILTLACNDTRLLIGSTQGPIAVYDCSKLFTTETNEITPIHTFSGSRPCEQIAPNPGDIPELVAVLRQGDSPSNPSVEILNLQNFQLAGGWASGGTPDTTPSSLSWSPRGKQLAIGLHSGDIVTFSPTSPDSPKSHVYKPPAAGDNRVLAITWLANPTFHTIYVPPGPVSPKMAQNHYVVNFDSKSNSASDISLSAPYYPFPALRPPGSFVLVLRNWGPAKFLLFVGDSTSSDIGSIGCFVDSNNESWYNLSLDEACTPSLPLDKNLDDTVILGLELDLTATDSYDHTTVSGEKIEVPPPPIVYAYCSDGTILAWHVVNASGAPYPGMINASVLSPTTDAPMSMTPSTSGTGETIVNQSISAFGSTQPDTSRFNAFGQAAKQPAFGQTSFDQSSQSPPPAFGSSVSNPSAFGAFPQAGSQPAFGQSVFGQSSFNQPSFGQSAFGQPSQPSTFSKPSGFGQSSFGNAAFVQPSSSSAFGSGGSASGGFASYASSTPAGFGKTSSPFDALNPPATQPQLEAKAPELTREISMGVELQESDFGGLSLGTDTSSDTIQPSGRGPVGLFGQVASQPTSSFSSSGFGSATLNPGFGAFSNWGQSKVDTPTPTSATPAETSKPHPSPAFGQSGFGSKPASGTFGQSSFGQISASGKPSFGGTPASSTPSLSGSSSGGFGAYANSFVSFTTPSPQSGTSIKPVWVTAKEEALIQKAPPKPIFTSQEPFTNSALNKPATAPSSDDSSTIHTQSHEPPSPVSGTKSPVFASSSASSFSQAAEPLTPLKSSLPAAPSGIFSNLKQSPVGFNTSSGVFGQPDPNSPLFKADRPSAFTSPSSTQASTPKPTPVGSVFGSPSPLGTSVFGKPSTFESSSASVPPPQTSETTTTGAFSAFAGFSSPFGKLDNEPDKSFSDLLKGVRVEGEPTKLPPSVFSLPTPRDEEAGSPKKEGPKEEPAKVFSVFTTPPKPSRSSQTSTPPSSDLQGESDDGGRQDDLSEDEISFKESSEEELEGEHIEDNLTSDTGSESFLDESLSYEDISAQIAEEQEIEGPHELSPVAEETSLHDESSVDESETSVQETLIQAESPDPGKIPLPLSRSPSTTPGDLSLPPTPEPSSRSKSPLAPPDSADIALPPTPLQSLPSSPSDTPRARSTKLPSPPPTAQQPTEHSPLPMVQEPSTTPPSSPAKLSPILPTPTPTSQFGIGLGRPSARPARSSPLTGAPILGEHGGEGDASAVSSPPSLLKPRPASPKVAFGQWGSAETPEGSRLARSKTPQKTPQTPPMAAAPSAIVPAKVITPTIPEPSLQEGMQAECAYLFTSMDKELEDLKLIAQDANCKREYLTKAKPVAGTKADLGDLNKWSMADISTHGKFMKQLEQDTSDLRDIQDEFLKSVRAIESNMLKATTRKEEIIRFSKATSNADFTKMLKARTLGPEHLETQMKLRKQMRNTRDRVEKLEGHLQASKKTLNRQKSGKVGFKAPSLDTINRTHRNIDIAITQQADDIAGLTSRIAKLDVKSFGKTSSRDKRLPDRMGRKLSVTPSVAATTAAALNAERSAYKLKQVLLSVRDKPLLNDKAAYATPSRVDFKTPQKPGGRWDSSNWQITPPTRETDTSPSSVGGSRRAGGSKHHQKSAQLKRPIFTPADSQASPTPAPAPASTGFDWGPLPSYSFSTKPAANLPFSIR